MRILLFLLLACGIAHAQKKPVNSNVKSRAEIQQQLQKELKQLEVTDPEAARMAKQLMNGSLKKAAAMVSDEQQNGVTAITFGSKNLAAIAAMKDRALSTSELKLYLTDLKTTAAKKISPAVVQAVEKQVGEIKDANKIGALSVAAWYNSSPEQALLLAINACAGSSSNPLLLNNLAAILNLGGAESKAVPLLKTIIHDAPTSATILNNLGQSYALLGMFDSSIHYLKACLQLSPHHPEANNTMGQIESVKANIPAATEYFRTSLKGAFNEGAAKALKEHDNAADFSKLIKPRVKFPSYFFEHKYHLPPQCTDVITADSIQLLYDKFESFINNTIDKYSPLIVVDGNKIVEEGQQMYREFKSGNLKESTSRGRPYSVLAGIMTSQLALNFDKDMAALFTYKLNRAKDVQRLKEELDEKEQTAEGCEYINSLRNRYLKAAAAIWTEVQQKHLRLAKEMFANYSYWSYLEPDDIRIAKSNYYSSVCAYLEALNQMAHTEIESNSCAGGRYIDKVDVEGDNAIKIQCPFDINIPLVVGKISLNCEHFSFKAGEGLVFKYNKEFESGQSTLSLGAGVDISVGGELLGISAKAGGEASESFYITFDGNNNFTDAGLSFDINASTSAEAEGGIDGVATASHELTSVSIEAGYKIGINSGITINEGAINPGPLFFLRN